MLDSQEKDVIGFLGFLFVVAAVVVCLPWYIYIYIYILVKSCYSFSHIFA